MAKIAREIKFGVIGCGLMGKEFASAAARWLHLVDLNFKPVIGAVCDVNRNATQWFADNIPSVQRVATDYHELLADDSLEAVYCAVPHHLHAQLYVDIIKAGKRLLGEKPFGIDLAANQTISDAIASRPEVLVRCSSEFPFYPGALQIFQWLQDGRFGQIMEVEAGFWHSSDLDPGKAINWKRMINTNGEYGCLGDLGLHVLHIPLRLGWKPRNVRALLSNIITQRPDNSGQQVPCETWDNAILATEVDTGSQAFPMLLSTKRIAPGHANSWFIKVYGTKFSAEFTTKLPKQLNFLAYTAGAAQTWQVVDTPYKSAYPTITGGIFEFGFSDAILQMWAAFCDELAHGDQMRQPFTCVTPSEAAASHRIFTAALVSQRQQATIPIDWSEG